MSKIITDTVPFAYRLVESNTPGPLRVKGVFQRADVENANRRIYPRSLWERILSNKSIQEAIQNRSMIGEADHPADGEMKLSRASHIITRLEMQPDGVVIGEAEILNTPTGLILQELFRRGAMIGISSRGNGSTMVEGGKDIVQEDFELQTFDFVANPSTPGAHPKVVESKVAVKEQDTMSTPTNVNFKELREKANSVLNENPSRLTADRQKALLEQAEEVTVELTRLANTDPGYSSLANELVGQLSEARKTLQSPPPAVEHQLKAAELVIREMAVQLKEREGRAAARLAEAKNAATAVIKEAKSRVTEAENKAAGIAEKYGVAVVLGNELIEKIKRGKVQEHVAALLASPKNAHLRPMREHFLQQGSVSAVNELVETINKLSKKVPVRESVRPVGPQTSSRNTDPLAESAGRIIKKNGLRF